MDYTVILETLVCYGQRCCCHGARRPRCCADLYNGSDCPLPDGLTGGSGISAKCDKSDYIVLRRPKSREDWVARGHLKFEGGETEEL